jgi:arylformamidase
MISNWIDITVPLFGSMVHWPGDPPIEIHRTSDKAKGDEYNLSEISMGSHSGTHIDAPLHIIENGTSVDNMDFNTTIGKARVIEIQDEKSIKQEEISRHGIRRGERILFKTRNSSEAWKDNKFRKEFVFLSKGAAVFLVERGVRLVGVDYLSIGSFKYGGSEVHRTLLGAKIWIIEGLNLAGVSPGRFDLICLPIKIRGGDGAPARAVLRSSENQTKKQSSSGGRRQ